MNGGDLRKSSQPQKRTPSDPRVWYHRAQAKPPRAAPTLDRNITVGVPFSVFCRILPASRFNVRLIWLQLWAHRAHGNPLFLVSFERGRRGADRAAACAFGSVNDAKCSAVVWLASLSRLSRNGNVRASLPSLVWLVFNSSLWKYG